MVVIRHVLVLLALLLPASLPAASAGQAAAARPDLTVSAVSPGGSTVVRGGLLSVRDTTKNVGTAPAPRTTTRFYLSRDRARSNNDLLLGGRAIPQLPRAGLSSGRVDVSIPATQPTGAWFVIACADAARATLETHEGNNCRASAAINVTLPPPPPHFPLTPDPITVGYTTEAGNTTTQG